MFQLVKKTNYNRTVKQTKLAALKTPFSPVTYPQILLDVQQYLKDEKFVCNVNFEEGRRGSQDDEEKVIGLLENKFGKNIIKRPAQQRFWYDILVFDVSINRYYPINIKTSSFAKGGDNGGSKTSILFSLTSTMFNMEKGNLVAACNRGWDTFESRLINNKKDMNRDYYFLVVHKTQPGVILLVGLRDVVLSQNARKSAPNLPYQIDWNDNEGVVQVRKFEDAYKHIITTYKNNVEELCGMHKTMLNYKSEQVVTESEAKQIEEMIA